MLLGRLFLCSSHSKHDVAEPAPRPRAVQYESRDGERLSTCFQVGPKPDDDIDEIIALYYDRSPVPVPPPPMQPVIPLSLRRAERLCAKYKGIPFFVLPVTNQMGHFVRLGVCVAMTVIDVKILYADKTNVPVTQQRLFYGNEELKDGKRLRDYGIDETSATLKLLPKLRSPV